MSNKLIGILFLLLPLLPARAQTLKYGVDFTYFFDNLEYGDGNRNTGFDPAMTLNAMRLTPEIGLGLSGGTLNHRLMAGVDIVKDMGSGLMNKELFHEITAYYAVDAGLRDGQSCFSAIAGIFPRTFSKAPFNPVFFDESVLFYDNNLEGFFFRYVSPRLYADLGLDWTGQYGGGGDPSRRERFMVMSYGRWNFAGPLDLEWTVRMDHYAGSPAVWGVVDNDLVNPMLIWHPGNAALDVIDISAGAVLSYQYDRRPGNLMTGGGFLTRQKIEKRHVGIDNVFYAGSDLMPFYDSYGSDLYFAEDCYHTRCTGASWCDQLHLFYSPHITDWLDLTVAFAFHFGEPVDGSPVFRGWQQMFSLKIDL